MATDPVCGMYVDERSPGAITLVRDNRTYYFCAQSCRESFDVPEAAARRVARRLAVAWPLAIVATALTYWPGPHALLYGAAAAATVVQFYSGADFYVGTWDALRGRMGNMDVLIATGTSAAYAYSIVSLLAPTLLPPGYFFDASTLVIALILTGNLMEHRTRARAGSATRDLERLLPREVLRVEGDGTRRISRDEIRIGDRLRVLAHESFPVDGTVREGRTEVDESWVTGESLPVSKAPGNSVVAGTRNGLGVVDVEATSIGPDTFIAQIGQLLSDAESAQVPLRRLADRIAAVFVPLVLLLALGAATAWALFGGASGPTAVLIFVTVVIIACPCAFGIATPAAILVGTSRAAEEGILFRGADSIEQAARTSVVVTDKTGTLTAPDIRLSEVWAAPGISPDDALSVARALEVHSEHALARALVSTPANPASRPLRAESVEVEPGRGVRGRVDGRPAALWSPSAARDAGISVEAAQGWIDRAEGRGETWTALVVDGKLAALFAFGATIAPGAREAVAQLTGMGIPIEMVTGDRSAPAAHVARGLGIGVVASEVTPEGKVAYVRSRQAAGAHVAFVGDGVNDAAALASADVGMAIGTGTEIARDAGRVLLVRGDFRSVPRSIALARAIVRKVRGNLAWAIGYNVVLLPIAAGILIPFLGFGVYAVLPVLGALAMAISSTTVLLNSLSLGRPSRRARATEGSPS